MCGLKKTASTLNKTILPDHPDKPGDDGIDVG